MKPQNCHLLSLATKQDNFSLEDTLIITVCRNSHTETLEKRIRLQHTSSIIIVHFEHGLRDKNFQENVIQHNDNTYRLTQIEKEGDGFICWTRNSGAGKANLETTFLKLGEGPTQRSVKEVKLEMATIALWEDCQAMRELSGCRSETSVYGNGSGNLLEFSPI